MDPLSQGALGAVAAGNGANRKTVAVACLLGWVAGMAADLDVFISSPTDPLLFLEYHRQFTHALVFIPVGGLICAALLHPCVRRWSQTFKQTLSYCTLGYATHALLDACTSYGTQLFWPFSHTRVAWSNIAIVDPLFTLPLIGLVFAAGLSGQRRYARMALVWTLLYLGFGVVQKQRVAAVALQLTEMRGHQPTRMSIQPSFANLILWKVVYAAGEQHYVDAVRAGLRTRIYPGQAIAQFDRARDLPWLDDTTQQAKDIQRFRWFSNDFIALAPDNPLRIIDIRYSMLPNEIDGLWMIELQPEAPPTQHVGYVHVHGQNGEASGSARDSFRRLWQMILGR